MVLCPPLLEDAAAQYRPAAWWSPHACDSGISSLNSRRRILFLAPRVPNPPDKGDKIRTCNVLRYLAARHEVYCACFCESPRDREHANSLASLCAQIYVVPWTKYSALFRGGFSLLTGGSVTMGAYQSEELKNQISRWGPFDCVYAFSGAMAPYALAARANRRLLDLCDADSEKWLDYARVAGKLRGSAYRCEGQRLRRLELDWLNLFDAISVITHRERFVLDPHMQCERLRVVSNGVDTVGDVGLPSSSGGLITFIGALDYPPNVDAVSWFAREIWPLVGRNISTARFQIVGRNPTRYVRTLAEIDGVEVVGEVAEVRPYLLNSRAVVAPLRIARGLPNKVLEAMAARRPVVTTSTVAKAIHARDGQELLIADSSSEFAARVIELLTHARLCDDIGEAACAFVRQNHDWESIGEEFERLLLGPQQRISSEAAPILQGTAARRPISQLPP
jgi:sugar transferase (PEP-CTERM/EpsH1 system associated)